MPNWSCQSLSDNWYPIQQDVFKKIEYEKSGNLSKNVEKHILLLLTANKLPQLS